MQDIQQGKPLQDHFAAYEIQPVVEQDGRCEAFESEECAVKAYEQAVDASKTGGTDCRMFWTIYGRLASSGLAEAVADFESPESAASTLSNILGRHVAPSPDYQRIEVGSTLPQNAKKTFGNLAIGDQFFDPDCGEDFVKLSSVGALMLTGGAQDDDDEDDFASDDPVELLDTPHELGSTVLARINAKKVPKEQLPHVTKVEDLAVLVAQVLPNGISADEFNRPGGWRERAQAVLTGLPRESGLMDRLHRGRLRQDELRARCTQLAAVLGEIGQCLDGIGPEITPESIADSYVAKARYLAEVHSGRRVAFEHVGPSETNERSAPSIGMPLQG